VTRAFPPERRWRQPDQRAAAAPDDITISRWTCTQTGIRHEEATTPADRYFFAIALKTSRAKLTRGRHTIFDGVMPAGTLYIGAPSQQLSAQFYTPCDFLHFHVSADSYFPALRPGAGPASAESLNDLVLLRDPFAEQLAKALTERGHSADREFARCIGQALAMHLARRELPQAKVNALPKWRLRRVEEYVGTHFDHCVSLSELAKVAGLSRMHFAAQFRAATAEVALTVGFCTQAHFSTVFKRITGDTPARWRCASRSASALSRLSGGDPASTCKVASCVLPADFS
jgi:AraC-like DNA-binding protein